MLARVFRDSCHISNSEFSFPFCFASDQNLAKATELAIFPHPCVWVVRTDATRIGPGVDRQQPIVHRGGDVHRAAIDADRKLRRANQADELQQRGLVREINAIFRRREFPLRFSHDDDALRREDVAEFRDHGIG